MNEQMKFLDLPAMIQGDVVLRKLENIPEAARLVETEAKVLQQSEITGHHHQFRPKSRVDLYQMPFEAVPGIDTITPQLGKLILVHEPSELFHGKLFDQEPAKTGTGDHNSFLVPPGAYFVDIVREYDYDREEIGRVVD